jgi:hypothetical protein
MSGFRGQRGPQWKQELRKVNNPDGVYSGMTAGLAAQDGAHVVVSRMPKDTRKAGVLRDENPHYD